MKHRYVVSLMILSLIGVMPLLWAQGRMGGGRRLYDVKSEVKVAGSVEEVQQFTGRRGWSGTHLVLRTDSGTLDVHVGPTAYIEKQQFSFAKGDSIEVLGSQIKLSGKDTLLAREITKDGKKLTLRDQNGFPLWSRRGQSASPK